MNMNIRKDTNIRTSAIIKRKGDPPGYLFLNRPCSFSLDKKSYYRWATSDLPGVAHRYSYLRWAIPDKSDGDNRLLSIPYYLKNSMVIKEIYRIKDQPFLYEPTRFCEFSISGEEMVNETLKVSPNFMFYFEQIYSVNVQTLVAKEAFKRLKEKLERTEGFKGGTGKKYFETKRSFGRLIPAFYQRTQSPRLSAPGNTFHGMKKDLLIEILIEFSIRDNFTFIDVDMSAAHSRIAKYLLGDPESVMGLSLNDINFWETQVNTLKEIYIRGGLEVPPKIIKKILKVGLYTSLNGGNPVSDARLNDNITLNAGEFLFSIGVAKDNLQNSSFWSLTKEMLLSFQLIREVKNLNLKCAFKDFDDKYKVYTLDRTSPYEIDSPHKGISRVLQGFEVVLLSILLYDVISLKLLPISLDHDGILLMAPNSTDPQQVCEKLSGVDSKFHQWSKYILEEPIPIEPKRVVKDGKVTEY